MNKAAAVRTGQNLLAPRLEGSKAVKSPAIAEDAGARVATALKPPMFESGKGPAALEQAGADEQLQARPKASPHQARA